MGDDIDFESLFGLTYSDVIESQEELQRSYQICRDKLIATDEVLTAFKATLDENAKLKEEKTKYKRTAGEIDKWNSDKEKYTKALVKCREDLLNCLRTKSSLEEKCTSLENQLKESFVHAELNRVIIQARDSVIHQFKQLVKEKEEKVKELEVEIAALKKDRSNEKQQVRDVRKKVRSLSKHLITFSGILEQHGLFPSQFKRSLRQWQNDVNGDEQVADDSSCVPRSSNSCSQDTVFGSNLPDLGSEHDVLSPRRAITQDLTNAGSFPALPALADKSEILRRLGSEHSVPTNSPCSLRTADCCEVGIQVEPLGLFDSFCYEVEVQTESLEVSDSSCQTEPMLGQTPCVVSADFSCQVVLSEEVSFPCKSTGSQPGMEGMKELNFVSDVSRDLKGAELDECISVSGESQTNSPELKETEAVGELEESDCCLDIPPSWDLEGDSDDENEGIVHGSEDPPSEEDFLLTLHFQVPALLSPLPSSPVLESGESAAQQIDHEHSSSIKSILSEETRKVTEDKGKECYSLGNVTTEIENTVETERLECSNAAASCSYCRRCGVGEEHSNSEVMKQQEGLRAEVNALKNKSRKRPQGTWQVSTWKKSRRSTSCEEMNCLTPNRTGSVRQRRRVVGPVISRKGLQSFCSNKYKSKYIARAFLSSPVKKNIAIGPSCRSFCLKNCWNLRTGSQESGTVRTSSGKIAVTSLHKPKIKEGKRKNASRLANKHSVVENLREPLGETSEALCNLLAEITSADSHKNADELSKKFNMCQSNVISPSESNSASDTTSQNEQSEKEQEKGVSLGKLCENKCSKDLSESCTKQAKFLKKASESVSRDRTPKQPTEPVISCRAASLLKSEHSKVNGQKTDSGSKCTDIWTDFDQSENSTSELSQLEGSASYGMRCIAAGSSLTDAVEGSISDVVVNCPKSIQHVRASNVRALANELTEEQTDWWRISHELPLANRCLAENKSVYSTKANNPVNGSGERCQESLGPHSFPEYDNCPGESDLHFSSRVQLGHSFNSPSRISESSYALSEVSESAGSPNLDSKGPWRYSEGETDERLELKSMLFEELPRDSSSANGTNEFGNHQIPDEGSLCAENSVTNEKMSKNFNNNLQCGEDMIFNTNEERTTLSGLLFVHSAEKTSEIPARAHTPPQTVLRKESMRCYTGMHNSLCSEENSKEHTEVSDGSLSNDHSLKEKSSSLPLDESRGQEGPTSPFLDKYSEYDPNFQTIPSHGDYIESREFCCVSEIQDSKGKVKVNKIPNFREHSVALHSNKETVGMNKMLSFKERCKLSLGELHVIKSAAAMEVASKGKLSSSELVTLLEGPKKSRSSAQNPSKGSGKAFGGFSVLGSSRKRYAEDVTRDTADETLICRQVGAASKDVNLRSADGSGPFCRQGTKERRKTVLKSLSVVDTQEPLPASANVVEERAPYAVKRPQRIAHKPKSTVVSASEHVRNRVQRSLRPLPPRAFPYKSNLPARRSDLERLSEVYGKMKKTTASGNGRIGIQCSTLPERESAQLNDQIHIEVGKAFDKPSLGVNKSASSLECGKQESSLLVWSSAFPLSKCEEGKKAFARQENPSVNSLFSLSSDNSEIDTSIVDEAKNPPPVKPSSQCSESGKKSSNCLSPVKPSLPPISPVSPISPISSIPLPIVDSQDLFSASANVVEERAPYAVKRPQRIAHTPKSTVVSALEHVRSRVQSSLRSLPPTAFPYKSNPPAGRSKLEWLREVYGKMKETRASGTGRIGFRGGTLPERESAQLNDQIHIEVGKAFDKPSLRVNTSASSLECGKQESSLLVRSSVFSVLKCEEGKKAFARQENPSVNSLFSLSSDSNEVDTSIVDEAKNPPPVKPSSQCTESGKKSSNCLSNVKPSLPPISPVSPISPISSISLPIFDSQEPLSASANVVEERAPYVVKRPQRIAHTPKSTVVSASEHVRSRVQRSLRSLPPRALPYKSNPPAGRSKLERLREVYGKMKETTASGNGRIGIQCSTLPERESAQLNDQIHIEVGKAFDKPSLEVNMSASSLECGKQESSLLVGSSALSLLKCEEGKKAFARQENPSVSSLFSLSSDNNEIDSSIVDEARNPPPVHPSSKCAESGKKSSNCLSPVKPSLPPVSPVSPISPISSISLPIVDSQEPFSASANVVEERAPYAVKRPQRIAHTPKSTVVSASEHVRSRVQRSLRSLPPRALPYKSNPPAGRSKLERLREVYGKMNMTTASGNGRIGFRGGTLPERESAQLNDQIHIEVGKAFDKPSMEVNTSASSLECGKQESSLLVGSSALSLLKCEEGKKAFTRQENPSVNSLFSLSSDNNEIDSSIVDEAKNPPPVHPSSKCTESGKKSSNCLSPVKPSLPPISPVSPISPISSISLPIVDSQEPFSASANIVEERAPYAVKRPQRIAHTPKSTVVSASEHVRSRVQRSLRSLPPRALPYKSNPPAGRSKLERLREVYGKMNMTTASGNGRIGFRGGTLPERESAQLNDQIHIEVGKAFDKPSLEVNTSASSLECGKQESSLLVGSSALSLLKCEEGKKAFARQENPSVSSLFSLSSDNNEIDSSFVDEARNPPPVHPSSKCTESGKKSSNCLSPVKPSLPPISPVSPISPISSISLPIVDSQEPFSASANVVEERAPYAVKRPQRIAHTPKSTVVSASEHVRSRVQRSLRSLPPRALPYKSNPPAGRSKLERLREVYGKMNMTTASGNGRIGFRGGTLPERESAQLNDQIHIEVGKAFDKPSLEVNTSASSLECGKQESSLLVGSSALSLWKCEEGKKAFARQENPSVSSLFSLSSDNNEIDSSIVDEARNPPPVHPSSKCTESGKKSSNCLSPVKPSLPPISPVSPISPISSISLPIVDSQEPFSASANVVEERAPYAVKRPQRIAHTPKSTVVSASEHVRSRVQRSLRPLPPRALPYKSNPPAGRSKLERLREVYGKMNMTTASGNGRIGFRGGTLPERESAQLNDQIHIEVGKAFDKPSLEVNTSASSLECGKQECSLLVRSSAFSLSKCEEGKKAFTRQENPSINFLFSGSSNDTETDSSIVAEAEEPSSKCRGLPLSPESPVSPVGHTHEAHSSLSPIKSSPPTASSEALKELSQATSEQENVSTLQNVCEVSSEDVFLENKLQKEPSDLNCVVGSGSVLSVAFQRYLISSQTQDKPKRIRKPARVKRMVAAALEKLVHGDFSDMEFCSVVEMCCKLKGASWQILVKYVVKRIKSIKEEVYDTSFTPPAPPLTLTQQRMLALIMRLNEVYPHLVEEVMDRIQFTLFRLDHAPCDTAICSLSRFYATVCKLQCDRKRLLAFCYDAFYCMKFKAHSVVFHAICAYPEAFPKAEVESDSPIIQTLVYLIFSWGRTDFGCTVPLRKHLCGSFGYDVKKCLRPEMFLLKLIDQMKSNPVPEIEQAIVLLAKNVYDWELVYRKIIDCYLVPIIEEYKKGLVSDFAVVLALKLFGVLGRPFPAEAKEVCQLMVDILESFLFSEVGSKSVEEAAMYSIILLCKYDFKRALRILKSWKAKAPYSAELLSLVEAVMKRRSIHWWTSFLREEEN